MKSTTNDGVGYCVWGIVSLIAGLFIMGVVFGPLAIYLGGEGIKNGSATFGTVVKVGGWVETVLTALGVVAMIAAQSGGAR